ncbi:MAG: glycoside hydrolase family 97 protein [Cyclobacteriaceae bacterium]|nr:glycoside hydrolase family 97 protein [Cyclobacteriaceae bacterium HetDA_MAG_MS6]
MIRFTTIVPVFYLIVLLGCNEVKDYSLSSPSGKVNLKFFLNNGGTPSYLVSFNSQVVIDTSSLGFDLKTQEDLIAEFQVESTERRTINETWERPWGETKVVKDHCNELQVNLVGKADASRKLNLFFKVYDDGIGFRYVIPKLEGVDSIFVLSEETQFNVAPNPDTWWIKADYNSYEKRIRNSKLSESATLGTPVTMKMEDDVFMSIHEANLTNYAGMTLKHDTGSTLLKSELAPWPDGVKVRAVLPMKSPWRTIQLSETAGGLITSNLIVNLNEPSKIENTSWIKPMKYVGIWWSLHLFLETWSSGPKHGATTENTKRYIDFAAANNIKGVLVEGWNHGWDTWLNEDSFDYTTPYPDFDPEEVVRYAKHKGVEFIGHQETGGNIPEFEARIDSIFEMYKSLGVHAIKTGYAGKIRVPGQSHHGQFMVNHYRNVVETAAANQIMINAHEPIKDTGIRRTWPNMMTREGVRGMEWNAWSRGNSPSHTVDIAFTRMLSGPVDYTPGIFDVDFKNSWDRMPKWEEFKARGLTLEVRTTVAKQLALMVVLYSPMVMAADMIENYVDQPAFQFVRDLDVDWEDQRVIDAEIGEYITIARKAKDRWFLGSITNDEERMFEVSLDFLDTKKTYLATIYADGENADWELNPYPVNILTKEVNAKTILEINLAKGGGQAIEFRPVD